MLHHICVISLAGLVPPKRCKDITHRIGSKFGLGNERREKPLNNNDLFFKWFSLSEMGNLTSDDPAGQKIKRQENASSGGAKYSLLAS